MGAKLFLPSAARQVLRFATFEVQSPHAFHVVLGGYPRGQGGFAGEEGSFFGGEGGLYLSLAVIPISFIFRRRVLRLIPRKRAVFS